MAALSLRAPDRAAPDYLLDVKKLLAGMAPVRMAFQPVVDLDGGRVVGYEALARFGTGHRAPGPYFAAAENLERREEVEALLLQHALGMRGNVPHGAFLAVNVTPGLLTSGAVWSTLTAAGGLAGVVIELTEHARIDNLPRLRRRLDTLRGAGCSLALDDVGAGWSGLRQVVELRPDIVKIDRSLVQRLHQDTARRAVAELLGAFTDKVGGQLLAEGVEHLDELDALLDLNVHLAQGYLLGRPQFGWPDVPPEAQRMLAERARAWGQVGSLVEPVPRVRSLAALGFLGEQLPPAALLVGDDRLVIAVWQRNAHGATPSGWTFPSTTVPAASTLSSALRSALDRDERYQFVPLVCVDSDGTALGVVPIAALVRALL